MMLQKVGGKILADENSRRQLALQLGRALLGNSYIYRTTDLRSLQAQACMICCSK